MGCGHGCGAVQLLRLWWCAFDCEKRREGVEEEVCLETVCLEEVKEECERRSERTGKKKFCRNKAIYLDIGLLLVIGLSWMRFSTHIIIILLSHCCPPAMWHIFT